MDGIDVKEIAQRIEAVAFDSDGVFFGQRVFVDPQGGEVLKERSFYDGAGVLLLLAAGIRVAFITREKSGFLEAVARKLNNIAAKGEGRLPQIDVFVGVTNEGKTSTLQGWLQNIGIAPARCVYMGDDIFDFPALEWIKNSGGLSAAPQQAEEVVKKNVHFVTGRRGGDGAVRDLVNFILEAKDIDPTKLEIPV